MERIVPFVTCEIPFCQHVCEFMLGVNVTDLDLGVQLTLSNNQSRATLWVRETCLIVGLRPLIIISITASLSSLKDKQLCNGIRMRCIWWNVINVSWNDVGVLDWDGVMHVWLDNCRRVSPSLSLGSISSVRYGMKYFNHQIPKIRSGNSTHA